jgi:hypothetical protein
MTKKLNKKFDKELFLDAAKMVERFDNAVKRHQNYDESMLRQSINLHAESLELLLDYLVDYGGKNVLEKYAQRIEFNYLKKQNLENMIFKPSFVVEIVEMIWRFNDGLDLHLKSQNMGEFAVNQYRKLRDERIVLLLDYFVELGWENVLKSYFQKTITLIPA